MSESGDYDPGPWKGYNFSSAKAAYDVHVGRSYGDAVAKGTNLEAVLEKKIKTDSSSPLNIICDVTGSMGEWPATIFSKLPYLDLEGKEYLGKDMEICFAAVGDANGDKYPLQVRPYSSGKDMEKKLKELIIEGGGGGQTCESYELAALYFARNVQMPNAIKPVLIFIGDEGIYDFVDKDQARQYAKVDLESKIKTKDLFAELQQKYSVYLIRKPYEQVSGDGISSTDRRIYAQWEKLIGAERISVLPDPRRVVDVIFGILASETDRIDYFSKEVRDRQTPDQVSAVMKALETIQLPKNKSIKMIGDGRSIMKNSGKGKPTKSLMDEE